jgi:outer membrane protein
MKSILSATAVALVIAAPAYASSPFKAGDVMVRARAINVRPDESGRVSNGDSVHINDTVVPELDFSYFFTPNVSAELIAAVTPHDVKTSSGINAGSVWLLPPTLTLQYHFTQMTGVIPYVGAGVNYTHFYDEKGGALNRVNYDDSFGAVLQAGADIPLEGNWYANVDVKKVYIDTKATFSPSGVTANVDIDPWIVGVGVGYKF